jgi:hypothetical protein
MAYPEKRYHIQRTSEDLPQYTVETTDQILARQEDGMVGYISVEQLSSHLGSGNTSSGSNIDTLGGTSIRTLYTKDSDTTYTSGSVNTDFLSGSLNWGSRALPQSFLDDSVNYVGKVLHFRAVGKFAAGSGNDTNTAIRLQIGDQIIQGSNLGTQTLAFSVNKPFEILGEVIITSGSASTCYSIGWCDQTGDMRRTPLSDVTISGSFSTLSPGDFKIIVSGSTNRTMTSYYSYFQVMN